MSMTPDQFSPPQAAPPRSRATVLLGRLPKDTLIAGLLLFCLVALGLVCHKDHGLSWDEPVERITGLANVRVVAETLGLRLLAERSQEAPDLATYEDRYYGPGLQIPITMYELLAGVDDFSQIWPLRHLYTFLVYSLSLVFYYFLTLRLLQDRVLALGCVLLLALTPRIFAESFYNIKDIGFLSGFVVAQFCALRFLDKPRAFTACCLALSTAFACSVRLGAGAVLLLTLAWFLLQRGPLTWPRRLGLVAGCCLVFGVLLTLFHPAAWQDPLRAPLFFLEALRTMAAYPWPGKVMFMGQFFKGNALPWFYLPLFFLVTTPLLISLAIASSGILLGKDLLLRRLDRERALLLLLLAQALLLPVLAIALRSTVYDGWRQFYFIYPTLLLAAMHGLQRVGRFLAGLGARRGRGAERLGQIALPGLLGLYLLALGWQNAVMHPFQFVYFNAPGKHHAPLNFELDYWGVSIQHALRLILATDPSPQLPLATAYVIHNAVAGLRPEERARIVELTPPQARQQPHYHVQFFRNYAPPFINPAYVPVAERRVSDIPLYRIYSVTP